MESEVEWLKEIELRSRGGGAIELNDTARILASMDANAVWVARMLVARLLPRLVLEPDRSEVALEFLLCQAEDANAFIRAWALYSLACIAETDEELRPRVSWMLREAYEGDMPSVRARAREGLRLLGRPLD